MTTAAIICPGPSLLHCGIIGDYDLTIAVNNAIKLAEADWLCAADVVFYRGLLGEFRPRTGVLTMDDVVQKKKTLENWGGLQWHGWSDIPLIAEHRHRDRPINWSLQAALCFAAYKGATQVDIYGCDLVGVEDATGYGGEDRTEDRWRREARDLQFTRDLLKSFGINTTRFHNTEH